MIKLVFVIYIVLLSSCCGLHTEVKYMYQAVTITRIDECGITSFYYKNKEDNSSGKIWVTYSGINDGFSGYIKFYKNNKVAILSGDGHFQFSDIDTTYFKYERIYAYNSPEIDTSTCYVDFVIKVEKEKNTKTNVKIIYNIDNNEWW